MNTQLIQRCLNDYNKISNIPCALTNEIPILWFGNEVAYRSSKNKIITVGINPSFNEFTDTKSAPYNVSLRFPSIVKRPVDICEYEKAMNEYFAIKPLEKWFTPIEVGINSIGATFGGKMNLNQDSHFKNIVIHIDYYTPVATNPTWGSLCKYCKQELTKNFPGLFDDLITELQPNVIIMFGQAGEDFVKTNNLLCVKQTSYTSVSGKKTYALKRYDYNHNGYTIKIITAPYWNAPFSPYKKQNLINDLPTLI